MNKYEWEREFYQMLSDGGWIGKFLYRRFYILNPMRLRRLASAMERGEISFRFIQSNKACSTNKVISPFPKHKNLLETQTGRVNLLSYWLDQKDSRVDIELDAATLRSWLNKTFTPTPTPVPKRDPEFMSRELSIAVECSRSLYQVAPASGATALDESKGIRSWLAANYPDLNTTTATRITQIVNPGKK